jgi:predicted methyltransferase/DNA-directed RNA polymerase subunit RPC12/RpoP
MDGMMWEDTVRTSADQKTARMDMESVVTEVASAVRLAEGAAGVSDILRVIARSEPVPVREVSRLAEIPVPVVAAVCNELRSRGVLARARPVRLTMAGREVLGADRPGHPGLDGTCPCCGGRGLVIPAVLRDMQAGLEMVAAGAPAIRPELDQSHCTVATKIRRVLRMHEAGGLAGQRILLLGDDDMVSVAIARLAAAARIAPPIRRLTVLDTDPAVLAWARQQAASSGMTLQAVEHDLRRPLPAALAGHFDVVCTDPPYTVAGAKLFLSRAVSALRAPGCHIFFSFGARRPQEMLRTQRLIAEMGLVLRSLAPNFNEYLGAGVLGGTSHLYHLRTSPASRPLAGGVYDGPLYTASTRVAAARPYRCAGCGTVQHVGPGAAWPRIASLRSAGCPRCGSATFRPMPLRPVPVSPGRPSRRP